MAVYSMTGYAMPRQALPTRLRQHCTKRRAARRERRAGLGRRSRSRSVNSRFLDLAFRLPDELRALEPALRELSRRAQARQGRGARRGRERRGDAVREPHARAAAAHLARHQDSVRDWLPTRAPLIGRTTCCSWCRGDGAPRATSSDARRSRPPRRCIERPASRRARAKASGWRRCCSSASTHLRELADAGRAAGAAAGRAQQQRFLERWKEALDERRRGAVRRARGGAGARADRGHRLRDPHRRGRGARAPALAPRRDRAPARQGRRDRQAAGLPDPGAAPRGQHAGLEVGRARAHRASRST